MLKQSGLSVDDEAAAWVARMDGGAWSDQDEAGLQRWLSQDVRRQGILLRAQAAWIAIDQPKQIDEQEDTLVGRISRRALIGGGAALAASIIGGVVVLNEVGSYQTDVGEIRRVPLADGSIAAINTGSKVMVHMEARLREVTIERGEAWFQVAKNPERPFVVEAGGVRVRAVGTAFSVRRRDDKVDILVTEGVVEAWSGDDDRRKISLRAGQRATVAYALDGPISALAAAPSAVDQALAWRSGKIVLSGAPLSDAVADFNRYNRRQIRLVDPALAAERLDGVFRTDDVEGFARSIQAALGATIVETDGGDISIGTPSRYM